jgi:hypothetical protein
MPRLTILSIVFIFISQLSTAQETTILATIGESEVNAAGVGQTFFGQKMSDGLLYFRGSSNGLRRSIWRTDGTVAGTNRVLQEETTFGGDWGQIIIYEDGFLINDDDVWKRLATGTTQLAPIPNMPQENIQKINQATNGNYYFTTERNDQLVLFSADSSFENVNEIGEAHPESFTVLVEGGNFGAIILNDNSFQDNFPKIYLEATSELIDLVVYLETLGLSIGEFTRATLYGDFLFVSYRDANNFFTDKVINMSTNQIEDFDFIREPQHILEYQDDLLIVSDNALIRFNTLDMTFQEVYDSVFPFSPSLIFQDKLYVEVGNTTINILELDLSDNTTRILPDTNIGDFFFNSKFLEYENQFYYISGDQHQLLNRYDFTNNNSIVIDTLSTNTGATVEHALEDVEGNLVISRRPNPIPHELYVIGDGGVMSSIQESSYDNLDVYPTITKQDIFIPADTFNNLTSDYEMVIFNSAGQVVANFDTLVNVINVSHLPQDSYYGILKGIEKSYTFRFMKVD